MVLGARELGSRTFGDGTTASAAPPPLNLGEIGHIDDSAIYGPVGIGAAGTILLPLIDGGAIYGPVRLVRATGGEPGDADYEGPPTSFEVWDADNETLVGALTATRGQRWQDPMSDAGLGALVVQNNHADRALLDYRRVVRCSDVNAGGYVFSFVIDDLDQQSIAPGEAAAQTTRASGKGIASRLRRALVYPVLGTDRRLASDQRVFDWAAPDLPDIVYWPAAVATETTYAGENFGIPDVWPDPDSEWIWDRSVGGGFGTGFVDPGFAYFHKLFTLPDPEDEGWYEVWGAADDALDLRIDGVAVLQDQGFYRAVPRRTVIWLEQGTHYLRVRAENFNYAKAGLLVSIVRQLGDGTIDTPIVRSDATWSCLGYPATAPGFTPGQILLYLVSEAVDRGVLPASFVCDFTALIDSNGDPWPKVNSVSLKIGSSILDALRQLGDQWIDWEMAPAGLVLRCWNRGAMGAAAAGATYTHGHNITSMGHRGST